MGASCSGYLCSGCRPRDKEPDTAAPREGLQGRKEQPLHTDGAPPQQERPSDVSSPSPSRKGATLPGQTPRACAPPPRPPSPSPGWPLHLRLRLYGARASGTRLFRGSRSRGDSVETEGERGRKAGSMKKGASCERKPAWMPSGKAGAEGDEAGGGVRVRPRVGSSASRGSQAVTLPASPHASWGSRWLTLPRKFLPTPRNPLGHKRAPSPATSLSLRWIINVRWLVGSVCPAFGLVTRDSLLPAGALQVWLSRQISSHSVNSWFSKPAVLTFVFLRTYCPKKYVLTDKLKNSRNRPIIY